MMSDASSTRTTSIFDVRRDDVRVVWRADESRLAAALDALVWWLADALPGGARRDRGAIIFGTVEEAELGARAARVLAQTSHEDDPFLRLGELDALVLPDAPDARIEQVRDALTAAESRTQASRDATPEISRSVGFETIGDAAPTGPLDDTSTNPTAAALTTTRRPNDGPSSHTDDQAHHRAANPGDTFEPASVPDPVLPAADAPGRWAIKLVDAGPNPARTRALLAHLRLVTSPERETGTIAHDLEARDVRAVYVAIVPATGATLRMTQTD